MKRFTRYQAAIIDDHLVLLLKIFHHREQSLFWIVPGGGREAGESEEECVIREAKEETGLDVVVERLLFEESVSDTTRIYKQKKTYLCRVAGGTLAPGCEPESGHSEILATGWFDLRDENCWDEMIKNDPITLHNLHALQHCLGYR